LLEINEDSMIDNVSSISPDPLKRSNREDTRIVEELDENGDEIVETLNS